MSVSSGFYNSVNHDRKYFTTDFARLFDGIIIDGIFSTIGTCFLVEAYEGMTVNVGAGLAWIHHTWTYNDAVLPVNGIQSEVLLDRIDALVLESNGEETVRENRIFFIKGVPSNNPQRPTLIHTTLVEQTPLCYIYRHAGNDEIRQADITNVIGTNECPFVSGVLQTISIDKLLPQWRDELDQFVESEEARESIMFEAIKESMLANKATLDAWIASEETEFTNWFNQIRNQLSEDAAGHLQNQIDRAEIERVLQTGFLDGEKTFSDDGTVISSVDSKGRTLVKTFTEGFLVCTTELKNPTGLILGSMVKTFGADGKTIRAEVTIL